MDLKEIWGYLQRLDTEEERKQAFAILEIGTIRKLAQYKKIPTNASRELLVQALLKKLNNK